MPTNVAERCVLRSRPIPPGASPVASLAMSWLAIALVAGFSVPAALADICVTCASPDASYSCAVDGVSAQSDDGRLRLYCITALAKAGGHASCAVARAASAPCAGPTKVLAAPVGLDIGEPDTATQAPAPQPLAGSPAALGQAAAPITKPAPADSKTGEPKTVEAVVKSGAKAAETSIEKSGDAAKSAAQSAGSMLQTAGKVVGDAAKKSWTCLSSLFGEC